MTARGDSLRCSRNPGSNFRSGLIAPREYRPRCRRRRRVAKVSCTAGRAKSDGNFRGRELSLREEQAIMKKFVFLAAFAFPLVAGTAVPMMVRPAVACATWHCGCQDHPAAVG